MAGSPSQNVLSVNFSVSFPFDEGPSPVMGSAGPAKIDEAPSIDEILSLPGGLMIDFSDDDGEDQVDEAPSVGKSWDGPTMGTVGNSQLCRHRSR